VTQEIERAVGSGGPSESTPPVKQSNRPVLRTLVSDNRRTYVDITKRLTLETSKAIIHWCTNSGIKEKLCSENVERGGGGVED